MLTFFLLLLLIFSRKSPFYRIEILNRVFVKMIINVDTFKDLQTKLKSFQSEKTQLEAKIQATPRMNMGALNFGHYQMNRKKEQLQSKILKLNSILQPDIIA